MGESKKLKQKPKFFGLDVDNPKTPRKILLTVLLIWALSAILISIFFWEKFENRGIFGDMFGAVNALFSGLAFAGIIYTILLQSDELKAQREELQLNREEMKLTRKEFEAQNLQLERTRFESTLFHVTNSVRLAAKHVFYILQANPDYPGGSAVDGAEAFAHLHRTIEILTSQSHLNFGEKQKKYEEKIEEQSREVNNYLSAISVVLNYVDRFTKNDQEEKAFYYTLVRSSFSAGEIGFLWHFVSYGNDAYIRKATVKEFLQIRV